MLLKLNMTVLDVIGLGIVAVMLTLLVIHERAAADDRLVEPLIRLWTSVWTFAWARGLVKQILDVIEGFEAFVRGRSPDIRARYAFLMGPACS